MSWTSMLAIYVLVWVVSGFFVLPFYGRRSGEHDLPLVAGHDAGAPASFPVGRVLKHVTILSVVIFGAFYLAFSMGWADPNVIAGRA